MRIRAAHAGLPLMLALIIGFLVVPPGMSPMSADDGMALCGRVIDMGTGMALPEARILSADRVTVTDDAGSFCLGSDASGGRIRVELAGYVGMTVLLEAGGESLDRGLVVEMVPLTPDDAQRAGLVERIVHQKAPEVDIGALSRLLGYRLSTATQARSSIRVLMPDGAVVTMDMDEYLKGVVPSEMPASWDADALKAQAVAARSWATVASNHADKGADVCTTTHCQAWKPVHYDTTDEAVEATHGIVARDALGHVISAFYFGHCDGHTRNVEDVWGGYLPYCRSVSCPCGYDHMWGHGVGMCQEGAGVMAANGAHYSDILRHYYTGISVGGSVPRGIVDADVIPSSGLSGSVYTFTMSYETEVDRPAVANVIIDGRAHAMDRVPGSLPQRPIYTAAVTLPAGAHTHRFYTEDRAGNVSRLPAFGSFDGPHVSAGGPVTASLDGAEGLRAHSFTLGTVADWQDGEVLGTRVDAASDGLLTLENGADVGSYASPSYWAPYPFTAVGVTWFGQVRGGGSVDIEIRRSVDGEEWSQWFPLSPAEDDPSERGLLSSDLLFGDGQALELRVTLLRAPEGPAPVVKNLRLVCIDASGERALSVASPQIGPLEEVDVISREEWGADEGLMQWAPLYETPRAVILHHTVFGPESAGPGGMNPAAAVRAIYYYHAVVREWGDIGYNYLVDWFGNVYEGRSGGDGVVGRHALQYSTGSIGVGLIGNYHEQDAPPPTLSSLERLLAWTCAQHMLDPLGWEFFIDSHLPVIMGHRDTAATICPGDRAYALIPALRESVRDAMERVPPYARLSAPLDAQAVRGVVDVQTQASAGTDAVRFAVDGVHRHEDTSAPFTWKWNTSGEADGIYRLSLVARNAVSECIDAVTVAVDNTPPQGTAASNRWGASRDVTVSLSYTGATAVQFSNGWLWEGEDLDHAPGSGERIEDPDAMNGSAWRGLGGVHSPGAWYGPYTCVLPTWQEYEVVYRISTPDNGGDLGLATLDVVDNHGERTYASRALSSADLTYGGRYEDVTLPLDYRSPWPPCDELLAKNGLEFRTWFSGAGDLTLDRVAVYAMPRALSPSMSWELPDVEGEHRLLVRFLDDAGNAKETTLDVGLDRTPPVWSHYGLSSVWVRDDASGLDPATMAWSWSEDGGYTWSEWEALVLSVPEGTTLAVPVIAPRREGTHVRFCVADTLGHGSQSAAVPWAVMPTATAQPSAILGLPLILRP